MGYLLKEALKTLCGVNQWSYAIFWKIGCQNPKLLIWEECYYEPIIYLNSSLVPGNGNPELASKGTQPSWTLVKGRTCSLGVQTGEKVHWLITKMMSDNYVNILGEGLVGRAAFTGNHQWILSDNYNVEAHPAEVINEVSLQFSAGMQTIAIIPVHTHGVVQFGSSLNIMENMGFVDEVRTLVFQLGCDPGSLLYENSRRNLHASETTANCRPSNCFGKYFSADFSGRSRVNDCTPFSAEDGDSQPCHSSQELGPVGHNSVNLIEEIQNNRQDIGSKLPSHIVGQNSVNTDENHCQVEIIPGKKQNLDFRIKLQNPMFGTEVIPLNSNAWLNQGADLNAQQTLCDRQPAFVSLGADYDSIGSMKQQISEAIVRDPFSDNLTTTSTTGVMISGRRNQFHNCVSCTPKHTSAHSIPDPHISTNETSVLPVNQITPSDISKLNPSLSNFADHFTTNYLLSCSSDKRHVDKDCMKTTLTTGNERLEHELHQALSIPTATPIEQMDLDVIVGDKEAYVKAPSGDDLFDIVGLDFKRELFNGKNNFQHIGPKIDPLMLERNNATVLDLQGGSSDVILMNEGKSDCDGFFGRATNHLIDAVVSKVHSSSKQGSDNNLSCSTSLTRIESSSAPAASSSCEASKFSDMQRKLVDVRMSQKKTGVFSSCPDDSGFYNEDGGNVSEGNSTYASQISSWVEQKLEMKRHSGVSSAYSEKPHEVNKSNRKRLKPGENPRPRPKDRQMIQDRIRELREIVPNGAKCSIDALLEQTIKHMIFLQSVTKHTDKLKQACNPKRFHSSRLIVTKLRELNILPPKPVPLPPVPTSATTGFCIVNKNGELMLRDNFEGGATWAYEVGSQSVMCPIIVEDLDSPNQMLVEMICEERGLFLEIAEIIRGIGLTILKGVVESRNDKIWAHFIVEANRDVTRMEIFISLVRLLEETVKISAATSANRSDNFDIQSFPRDASTPATGRSGGLQ